MANKFFLGGLNKKTTTQDIQNFFSKYGDIEDAIVMVQGGESRGFGFVTFRDGPRAISLGILANDNMIHDRRVDVKSTIPESDIEANIRSKSIRVSNINPNTPDSTLHAHFSKFGQVTNVARESATSVVVDFTSEDQCENAFRAQAHDIDGAIVKVEKHGGIVVRGRNKRQDKGGRGGGRGGPMRDQGGRNDVHPYQKPQYAQEPYRYEQPGPVPYPQYGYNAATYDYNAPYQPYGANPYQQYATPDPYGYGTPYGAPPAAYPGAVSQQPGAYNPYGAAQGGGASQSYGGARSTGETDGADPRCKIFVGGLTEQTNGQSLKSYFQKFGEVVSAEVKMQGGKSRKFGFVVFANPGSVTSAAQQHYHQVDGKQVEVKPSDGGNRRS